MTKSVKTYPGKNRENWEEFREFPGKNVAITREFPGRKIPAVNPKDNQKKTNRYFSVRLTKISGNPLFAHILSQ